MAASEDFGISMSFHCHPSSFDLFARPNDIALRAPNPPHANGMVRVGQLRVGAMR